MAFCPALVHEHCPPLTYKSDFCPSTALVEFVLYLKLSGYWYVGLPSAKLTKEKQRNVHYFVWIFQYSDFYSVTSNSQFFNSLVSLIYMMPQILKMVRRKHNYATLIHKVFTFALCAPPPLKENGNLTLVTTLLLTSHSC